MTTGADSGNTPERRRNPGRRASDHVALRRSVTARFFIYCVTGLVVLGLLLFGASYRTAKFTRDGNYNACLRTTSSQAFAADGWQDNADRETDLGRLTTGAERDVHFKSAGQSYVSAVGIYALTSPSQAGRETLCRHRWPRLDIWNYVSAGG